MRTLLAIPLMLAFILAGCTGGGNGDPDPTQSPTPSPTATPTPTPGDPGGNGAPPEPIVLAFSTALPCPDCFFVFGGASACPDWMSGVGKGTRCDWAELPEEAEGRPFVLTGSFDPEIEFFDACTGASANSLGMYSEEGDESGNVPQGARCAVVWDFSDFEQSMTLTIT